MSAREPLPAGAAKASFFEASEWRQIISSLVFATLTLFGIGMLFGRDQGLATTLLSSVGMQVVGARAPAILLCLVRGMSPLWTLMFNFYIEIIIVFLCYYAFVLIIREGIESKFLHLAAKKAEASAQEHRNFIKRFELVGLFFFVMAPFPITGPVTGALVGYLLNQRPWVTFVIVFSGTFAALGGYVLLGMEVLRYIIEVQHEYQDALTLAISFLIAAFTIYHVRSISAWVKEIKNQASD